MLHTIKKVQNCLQGTADITYQTASTNTLREESVHFLL